MLNLSVILTILAQSDIADPNQFNGYLILAYAVIGLIGLVYVLSLFVRQRNVQQDLKLMRQLLEEDEAEQRK
ncbi:MAG: hypothetical protein H6666_04730 [Ardenticatenaceae bacterium]|nr:hypothetical protein [Anaerolineales bacterium]MCB8917209.1 hypothetical protein [Ardenticatenaceae bacterium]